jgi:hypothetical protein
MAVEDRSFFWVSFASRAMLSFHSARSHTKIYFLLLVPIGLMSNNLRALGSAFTGPRERDKRTRVLDMVTNESLLGDREYTLAIGPGFKMSPGTGLSGEIGSRQIHAASEFRTMMQSGTPSSEGQSRTRHVLKAKPAPDRRRGARNKQFSLTRLLIKRNHDFESSWRLLCKGSPS